MQDYDEVEIEHEYTFPQSMVDILNNEERKCCALCWTLYVQKSTKDEIVYLNQNFVLSAEFTSLFPMGCPIDSIR